MRDGVRATPWNLPSKTILRVGTSLTYGVRLVLAPSIEQVPAALFSAGVPVATVLPGASLHVGMAASLEVLLPSGMDGMAVELVRADVEPAAAVAVELGPARPIDCRLVRTAGVSARLGCGRHISELPRWLHTLRLITSQGALGRCTLTLHYASRCVQPGNRSHESNLKGGGLQEAASRKGTCPGMRLVRRLEQTVHLFVLDDARSLLMRHGTYASR